jgi:hypothetical protein
MNSPMTSPTAHPMPKSSLNPFSSRLRAPIVSMNRQKATTGHGTRMAEAYISDLEFANAP